MECYNNAKKILLATMQEEFFKILGTKKVSLF